MSENIKFRAAAIKHISEIARLATYGVPDHVISNLTKSFNHTCALSYDRGFLEGATDDLTKLILRKGMRKAFDLSNLNNRRNQGKSGRDYALTFDVANLKFVNDNLGSSIGDAVLVATTEILMNAFRDKDIIARTGGDEFTVFLMDVENEDGLNTIKERIAKAHQEYGCVPSPIGPYPFNFRYTTIEIPVDPNLDKKDPDPDAEDFFNTIIERLDAKKGPNKIEVRHNHRDLSL